MLPGKTYTPEDILGIVWRRKWIIAVPFVVAVVCTALITQRLPRKYRSETVILVVPQRIPESYVKSTISTRIEDRLASLREQVRSRSRLERVIQDFGLYAELQRTAVMEDVVAAMRNDIDIEVERGDSFRVSYVNEDPATAQRVTERLAFLFIEENRRERSVQVEGTDQFLESQLEEARNRLLEHEKKLEGYKMRFSGQLPSQVTSNLQAIQSAQLQLQSIRESIDRDRSSRLVLERSIADLLGAPETPALLPGAELPAGASTAQQLDAAQGRLRGLELKYKPEHPDIKAAKATIRDLEAKLQSESAQAPAGSSGPRVVGAAEAARQTKLRDLNEQLRNLDSQLERKRGQDRQLQAEVSSYQAKVEAAPTREAELTELTRDYETLQNTYTSLLTRRQDAKVSANLERTSSGEQFKVMDPARLPERPSSPDVMKINLVGAILGLAIGIGLVALLEYRDTTFKTEFEVQQLLQLPVLALVPMMASEMELRAARRRGKLAALAVGVVVLSSAVALLFWKLQTS